MIRSMFLVYSLLMYVCDDLVQEEQPAADSRVWFVFVRVLLLLCVNIMDRKNVHEVVREMCDPLASTH